MEFMIPYNFTTDNDRPITMLTGFVSARQAPTIAIVGVDNLNIEWQG